MDINTFVLSEDLDQFVRAARYTFEEELSGEAELSADARAGVIAQLTLAAAVLHLTETIRLGRS